MKGGDHGRGQQGGRAWAVAYLPLPPHTSLSLASPTPGLVVNPWLGNAGFVL